MLTDEMGRVLQKKILSCFYAMWRNAVFT